MIIKVFEYTGSFAEDKDAAKELREECLIPTLNNSSDEVILDFQEVQSSTQSFIHALISKILQEQGEAILSRIRYINCADKIKGLIIMVTNYSLE